tara:strand:+ start:562 stop:1983 length:1422 start_codon:yes stop_codon:yes gene_type:complete
MANEVNIKINAKDLASRQIKRVGSAAERAAEKMRSMSGSFMKMGAAGGAVTGILALAAKSSSDQRIGVEKLNAALKNVGQSYVAEKEAIEGAIGAIQLKTNFGDEEQRESLQKLIAVSGDYEISLLALPAIADLAAGANMDFSIAADMVGKALAGNPGALRRVGIELDKNATKTEILEALTDKFGGTAEAAADPMTQFQNRLGDLVQVLGDVLLPIIDAVLPALEKFIRKFVELAERNSSVTKIIGLTVAILAVGLTVFSAIGLVLPSVISGIMLLKKAFMVLRVVTLAWNLVMAMNPLGLLAIAIGVLVTVLLPLLIKNWDAVVDGMMRAWDAFQNSIKSGIDFMIKGIEMWINIHIKAINMLLTAINKVSAAVPGNLIPQIGLISEVTLPRFKQQVRPMPTRGEAFALASMNDINQSGGRATSAYGGGTTTVVNINGDLYGSKDFNNRVEQAVRVANQTGSLPILASDWIS